MINNKDILIELINGIPDDKIKDIIDFTRSLKIKNNRESFEDLEKASESGMEFWDNDIDDLCQYLRHKKPNFNLL